MRIKCVLAALLAAGMMPTQGATLEDAIRTALEHNPGLEAARQRVAAARAARDQARSGWYPHLAASVQAGRSDNPTQAFMTQLNQRELDFSSPDFDPADPDDQDNIRYSLSVRYALFDGGQRRAATQMSAYGQARREWLEKAARHDLVYEVTRAYYHALRVQAALAVHDDAVKSLQESVRVARERLAAGSTLRTDVLNLEVQLAQANEDRARTRNGMALAMEALNLAIGVETVDAAGLTVPEVGERVPDPSEPHAGSPEDRPEYQAARAALLAQRNNVKIAQAAYWPSLNVFGSLDWDSDGNRAEQSYTAGVMLTWDVFDGFRRSGALALARAREAEASAMLRHRRNLLQLDIKRAVIEKRDAEERLNTAARTAVLAKEALSITRERYRQKGAQVAELLTAHAAHTASKMRETTARFDVYTACANVDRARGRIRGKDEDL